MFTIAHHDGKHHVYHDETGDHISEHATKKEAVEKVKSLHSEIKKTGTFKGKSNKLGHGGRAAQLRAKGVPEGVIGMLARKAHAAPGQANYHGKK
jgi:hypothetical protein